MVKVQQCTVGKSIPARDVLGKQDRGFAAHGRPWLLALGLVYRFHTLTLSPGTVLTAADRAGATDADERASRQCLLVA